MGVVHLWVREQRNRRIGLIYGEQGDVEAGVDPGRMTMVNMCKRHWASLVGKNLCCIERVEVWVLDFRWKTS